MIWAFFSRRLRTWALFAVLLPLAGRILDVLGRRVTPRNPRVGGALTSAAGYARRPSRELRGARRRRRFR